jgi:hypothetical protein
MNLSLLVAFSDVAGTYRQAFCRKTRRTAVRSTTRIAFASLLAIGTSGGVYASAHADDVIPTPAPPSYDLVAQFGTKSGCVPVGTVAREMLLDQDKVGGRTLALTEGMDQAFADQWRHMAHMPPVKVKVVLAHGFAVGSAPSDTVIDTVEFDERGCAISRTLLKSDAWDTILHGVANVLKTDANDTI